MDRRAHASNERADTASRPATLKEHDNMGPLEHHATIVARMQKDIDDARRGWALAYDDGHPSAGTVPGARSFARSRWGEAEAARLFEDAAVARDNPDSPLAPANLPAVIVTDLRRDAQGITSRFWPPGYHSTREVVDAIVEWGATLIRMVSPDAGSRLAFVEQRLAALRAEKKRALQLEHGFVRCEACCGLIDLRTGEMGRDYVCDEEGCYLCRGCWPPELHRIIDDTTKAIEAAVVESVGDVVEYSEDNVQRVSAAVEGVLSKAIGDGYIGPSVDVTVRPVDPARRIVDVEVTIDRLRRIGVPGAEGPLEVPGPMLCEDALRELVDVAQDLAGMRAGLGDDGPQMPLEEDRPGATAAINRARAVLGLGVWP